jgi:hypothetical protein
VKRRKKTAVEKATPPHRITVILSVAAVIISLVSAGNSIYQTIETQKIYRIHVQPDVRCVVRHSSKPEYRNVPMVAELVVWNNGPIKAVSVGVSYRVYVYNATNLDVFVSMGIAEDLLNYALVQPELSIGQNIAKTILSMDTHCVYVINTTYYRESDMQKFSRDDYIFYDPDGFHSYDDYKTKKDFEVLMKNLQRKIRAEQLRPDTQNFLMSPAQPGACNVYGNFGNLTENGTWTNRFATNVVTFTPVFQPPN